MAKKDKKDFTGTMNAFFSNPKLSDDPEKQEELEWKRTTIIINPAKWEDFKSLALFKHEDAQDMLYDLMNALLTEAEKSGELEEARKVYTKKMQKRDKRRNS